MVFPRRKLLNWRDHDPYEATHRIHARQDLYNAPNQSLARLDVNFLYGSEQGHAEGVSRPPRFLIGSLTFEDWEVDLEGTNLPGNAMGKGQELNERTHPHMQLGTSMVSIPKVEPGDQAYWHCEAVHAVESRHQGKSDSSVLYIPAVPLTINELASDPFSFYQNADEYTSSTEYVRDQKLNFLEGLPSLDFAGGEGETYFKGRSTPDDVKTPEGRRILGHESVPRQFLTGKPKEKADFWRDVDRILG